MFPHVYFFLTLKAGVPYACTKIIVSLDCFLPLCLVCSIIFHVLFLLYSCVLCDVTRESVHHAQAYSKWLINNSVIKLGQHTRKQDTVHSLYKRQNHLEKEKRHSKLPHSSCDFVLLLVTPQLKHCSSNNITSYPSCMSF